MGLTSRDGIIPLYLDHDIGGPMARTVADAVAVFDVIAGYDPADPVTAESRGHVADSYADMLDPHALNGARLGVMRQWSNRDGADEEVLARFEEALDDLRIAGAEIVDSVMIPEMDELRRSGLWCSRFKHDLNDYLSSLGPEAEVRSLDDVLQSRGYHPNIRARLEFFRDVEGPPNENDGCVRSIENRTRLRAAVRRELTARNLDAMIFPTWANAPRLIGDLNSPHGDNSQDLSPHTGFPAITVPMGYVKGTLPVGLQFFGDAWTEPKLVAFAFAYEQATKHRIPPATTPPLRN
jgi:Asp-tRNA(Asn)/Glu-tRNA(Gln) amidotransferase A subunit family amidase